MKDSTKRKFLQTAGVVGITGLTGCSQIAGGNGTGGVEESDPSQQDDENADQSSEEEQSNTLKESFEEYSPGSLPTNWFRTQGTVDGTKVVAESDVKPDAVVGTQMLAISWNEDMGADTDVVGWPTTDSQESYTPTKIGFSLYDKVEQSADWWHFEANSPDAPNGRILYITGGDEKRRFRFGTGNQDLFTIRDTYWSQGWHRVEFLNINWENNSTDIAIDGNTVQEDVSFVGSKIYNIEFRANNTNYQDLLIDNIEITLGEE